MRKEIRLPICQNQDFQDWRDLQDFDFVQIAIFAITGNSAKMDMAVACICQNQDFQDWRDLQDFDFVRLALFAITEDSVKANSDERLPVKDESVKS